jgi:hypothetical protein
MREDLTDDRQSQFRPPERSLTATPEVVKKGKPAQAFLFLTVYHFCQGKAGNPGHDLKTGSEQKTGDTIPIQENEVMSPFSPIP